jgi:hypothetical protein
MSRIPGRSFLEDLSLIPEDLLLVLQDRLLVPQ